VLLARFGVTGLQLSGSGIKKSGGAQRAFARRFAGGRGREMCRSMVVIMVVDESFTPRGTAALPSTPRQIGITPRQRERAEGG